VQKDALINEDLTRTASCCPSPSGTIDGRNDSQHANATKIIRLARSYRQRKSGQGERERETPIATVRFKHGAILDALEHPFDDTPELGDDKGHEKTHGQGK
jgi:hypothetical protein